jgi:hypothetical protein
MRPQHQGLGRRCRRLDHDLNVAHFEPVRLIGLASQLVSEARQDLFNVKSGLLEVPLMVHVVRPATDHLHVLSQSLGKAEPLRP